METKLSLSHEQSRMKKQPWPWECKRVCCFSTGITHHFRVNKWNIWEFGSPSGWCNEKSFYVFTKSLFQMKVSLFQAWFHVSVIKWEEKQFWFTDILSLILPLVKLSAVLWWICLKFWNQQTQWDEEPWHCILVFYYWTLPCTLPCDVTEARDFHHSF